MLLAGKILVLWWRGLVGDFQSICGVESYQPILPRGVEKLAKHDEHLALQALGLAGHLQEDGL